MSRCSGLIAVDPAQAVDHFDASTRAFGDLDAPFEQARSELLLGESLQAVHGADAARFRVARAQESFEMIGADPWAGRAADWLARS